MYASYGTFAFAASAADAVNKLGDDVEEFAFSSKLVNLLFDFRGLVVLDGHACPLS